MSTRKPAKGFRKRGASNASAAEGGKAEMDTRDSEINNENRGPSTKRIVSLSQPRSKPTAETLRQIGKAMR